MTEFLQSNYFESQKPVGKPSVIQWNGVRMVRSHSIQAVAKEIINMSSNQDMVSINAIGKQGQGKTEILKTISHLVHKHSKLPWTISYLSMKHILELKETVKNLKPTNHILIFDDIGFIKAVATSKQIDQIQQTLSVIRHLPEGKDVHIILMKSFQYSKSISPFLRQNDVTILASVDDNEFQNYVELLGKKYYSKIKQLAYLRAQGASSDKENPKFVYDMGGGKKVIYGWKNPFLPFLYKTGTGCRLVVSPLRTFVDPICNVCAPSNLQQQDNPKEVKQVIEDFTSKFGDSNVAKTAVKIKLIQQGINAFSPRIVQAVKYLERIQQDRLISIDAIASVLGVTQTNAILPQSKQPLEVLVK